ncbi:sodium-dependent transporter, partial [candidate division KSB1 bacterium]
YLFYPDWAKLLNYRVWLEGLSQSAWSTGAGWGLILTYGIYLKEKEHIVSNSFITGLGNCSASLIVSLAIIPTVFSILPYQDAMTALRAGNTGFTFVWIPHLFDKMPAGSVFATIFFLALFFAALSSLISMIELTTRIFMDMGMQRRQAIKLVWTIGFLLGVPSAISLSIFNNQDWVWGIGLLLSGFFFAVAVNKFGARNFRLTLLNVEHDIIKVGRWFEWVLKYLIPVEFVALLLWWFYQSIVYYEPNSWWNPFKTYSLGTCLVQWGVVLTIFIIFNRQITRLVLKEKNS